jgi:hypothetical protein
MAEGDCISPLLLTRVSHNVDDIAEKALGPTPSDMKVKEDDEAIRSHGLDEQ